MLKNKKIILLVISAILGTSLIGCGSSNVNNKSQANNKSVEAKADKESAEFKFVESDGREVILEKFPEKIVTDSAISARFLAALDVDLVGVPTSSTQMPEKYKDVAKVGRAGSPDYEVIKNLGTELVVSTEASKKGTLQKYDELNIPIMYLKIDKYEQVKDTIDKVGKLLNKEEKCNEILKDMNKREDAIKAKVKDKDTKKVMVIYGNGEGFNALTDDHFIGSLFEKLKVENITSTMGNIKANGNNGVPFSNEQVLEFDPEYILRLSNGNNEASLKAFNDEFEKNTIWSQTKAFKEKKVIDLDPTLFRMSSGVNSIDALENLYELLYEK